MGCKLLAAVCGMWCLDVPFLIVGAGQLSENSVGGRRGIFKLLAAVWAPVVAGRCFYISLCRAAV